MGHPPARFKSYVTELTMPERNGPRSRGDNPRAQGTNPRATDPLATEDLTPEMLRAVAHSSYARYRHTKHWRKLKAAVAKRAAGCCERCGAKVTRLDTHHKTYERLGEELLTDLEGLCRGCHERHHGKKMVHLDGMFLKTNEGVVVGRLISLEVEMFVEDLWGTFKEGESFTSGERTTSQGSAGLEGGGGGNQIEPDDALAVWAVYVATMKPRGVTDQVLPAQERKLINEALKVATVQECSTAIRGCFASDFHMQRGRYANAKGRRYNRLSDILRGKQGKRTTRESIDLFIEYTAKSGGQSSGTSVDAAKLRQAKQAVRDHAEFPGDENVADRGRRAEAWLIQQGFTVSREGEQITFVPPADLSA